MLIDLFRARFDPEQADETTVETVARRIEETIDAVESLDQDQILRRFLAVVRSMLRTNFFQRSDEGREPKPYVSFKLEPSQLNWLPDPRPAFEIFVYSPRTEGVHLRGGRVARGGLRWSDRREDFRTEVLGLMKAQMVKNAVIVPVGAKGGFVVKQPPESGDREELQKEVIECYRTFIRGLLDLTDNIVGGEVTPPRHVVRYDGDDPYLVVAADKGTASFSDIANGVAEEYGFWLGDAFASGGSSGYDHKKMGITAAGAWESVKRHFRELGRDVSSEPFTVIGIGDMSGDVFGNGMLLSREIRLIGAFNHREIFIDPDPDPESSWEERKRLFELPRSSWSDYDKSLISQGGGVWPRTAKVIELSDEAREALGVEKQRLTPNEVIRALLRAPADLLWNGGIGTYVKASHETHADAGDKTNDGLRVDASELRCRVVGEGGNLGLTQPGRIEYALGGGRINTDAIDNSGGVDCSDREVNIKILLDAVVDAGDMTVKQRNALLAEMTETVADLVLKDNYEQSETLTMAETQAPSMLDVHQRFLRALEQHAKLDRRLEALPDEEEMAERARERRGLTRPELAVLLAYSKVFLYAELLDSDVPEDPYLSHELERYFPPPLPERYPDTMRAHRLHREIIATQVVNNMLHGGRHHVRLPAERGDGRSAVRDRARLRRRARGLRDAPAVAGHRGPRQRGARRRADGHAARGPAPHRARLTLAPPEQARRRWTSLPPSSATRRARRSSTSSCRTCSTPTTSSRSRAGSTSSAAPACPTSSPRVSPVSRTCTPRSTSSRWPTTAASTCRPWQRCTSGSAAGSGSTGCTTGSWRCRARTAGRRWRAPRCATTSTRSTASSQRRCCARGRGSRVPTSASTGWIEAHRDAGRCLQTLADIAAGRTFDITTLSVAVREVRELLDAAHQDERA